MLDDVDAMIGPPMGQPIAAAGISGWGVLSMPTRRIVRGKVLSIDYTLTCRRDLFGALPTGTPITVAGVPYTVRSAGPADDGSLALLILSKAEDQPA
jgi:hypothetical protein